MVLILLFLLSRELRPLKKLTTLLDKRAPDQDEPLDMQDIPSEVRPLINALNQLFSRTQAILHFTSDAAHELCTPLAAL